MRVLVAMLCGAAVFGQTAADQDYVFGFLRAHPERREIAQAEAMAIQKGHMAHLAKMAEEGILVSAGPLADSPDLRGVVIFRGITLEQARRAAEQDPAVAAKRLRVDAAPWRGPAGIGEAAAAWMKEHPGESLPMTKRTLMVYWKTPAAPAAFTGAAEKAAAAEHAEFIRGLRAAGEALAAGALRGSEEFVGVIVFASPDVAAAMKRCEADPFVKRGWVRPQAFVWYVAEATFAKAEQNRQD